MSRRFDTMCYVTLDSSFRSHSKCERGCTMNELSAMLLSLWTEGRKEIFTDFYLHIFRMMCYLSEMSMSGLRC